MSVPEQVPYKEYRATGSNNSFEITFYLPDPKDLVVMVNKEIPPVGAYSVQGNTVVFNTPPNEGDLVELTRDTQLDRETNFKSYDNSFRPETINFDLDKIWLVLQESNLVDAKILARLKQEIEWRRTHDFNYDELAQVREKQLFDALKGYTDTLNAATNPGVFQGVIAGVVFAQDGKSIQTHLEEILETLAQERENIDSKADKQYVDDQLGLKAPQSTTYTKTEVDSALDQKASKVDTYTKAEVDTTFSSFAGGRKGFTTLALAQAAQSTLPADTVVDVTNDPNPVNNGTYQWNGTTLTKSAYAPLEQAKLYSDSNPLFKPRVLVLNEDINSLPNGIYIIPSTAVASSLIGLPENMKTPKIGYVFSYVAAGGIAFQHIVHYTEVAVEEWKRVGNGSSTAFAWKEWQKELEKGDIASYQGFLFGRPSSINFDNVNLKLVIGSETRAIYDNTSTLLPAHEIPYPAGGTYNIVLNKSTKKLSFKAVSTGVVDGEVIVGSWFSTGYVVGGISAYTVNGSSNSKSVFAGEIVGDAVNINFDLVNNTLIIAANLVRALVGNSTTLVLGQTVPLPVDNYWYRIVFDPTSSLISFVRTSIVLSGDQVQVGEFDSRNRKIYGIISYSINGSPATAGTSDLLTSELIVINGNTDAGYIQETELSGYAEFLSTAIHSDVYALYDNLVAQYPEYVSRSLLGNDTTGKPVYRYDFKAPDVVAETHSGYLPKMILVSGVHGFEKSGIMNLYNTLKTVCEQWEQNERLETLRWNCHFIVVPLVVPSGFDSNIRHNANAVDIARNFPADWEQGVVGDITYGGTAPLSEVESQYIDDLISSNTDAIYFMSHHNFGSSDPARFVWNASATRFGVRLGKMLINRLTHSLKKRYPWVGQYPNYIGISNINAPNGSEGKHATKAYGVQGGTFEIGNNLQFAPDTSQYNSLVATIGVEILVNWLLLNLEYGSQLYNSKINL